MPIAPHAPPVDVEPRPTATRPGRTSSEQPERSPIADNGRDLIVGLDADDAPFPIEKWQAHIENVRHLAVSVFVFSDGHLLLQRRAHGKYHSGGLWANTCCSHPRWREAIEDCAARRVTEELGIRIALQPFARIDYDAFVGAAPARIAPNATLYENESVHCFVGHADRRALTLDPDPAEVVETRWTTLDALFDDVASRPQRYSAWLRIYVREHGHVLAAASARTSPAEAAGSPAAAPAHEPTRLSEARHDAYHEGAAQHHESLR